MVKKIKSIIKSVAKVFAAIFLMIIIVSPDSAEAAVRTSTATGGDWGTASTWVGGVVPANADTVIIATTGGNSVTIGANKTTAGVTVNSGAILSFTGAFTLTVKGSSVVDGTINGSTGIFKVDTKSSLIAGTGTMNCKILIQQPTSIPAASNLTTTAIITLANTLTVASGATLTTIGIDSNAKTVENNGTINLNGNYFRTGGTAIWTQGTNAVLNISGEFTPSANITLGASASGNSINYNGATQAVKPTSYANLIFSGSGAKSVVTGTSVSGNLSIAPTGASTASIGAGLNISVGTLTVGGLGTINGTWGSTSSAATNKTDTYFTATTGIITVATDSRTAQATLTAVATPSTVQYGATSALSSAGGSGIGVVTFSVGTSTGCSVAGATLSVIDISGSCFVTATKEADMNYLSSTSSPLSVGLIAGETSQLSLSGPSSMNARTRAGLSLLRKDEAGNNASVGTTTVYLYTNSGSANAKFYDDSLVGSQITSLTINNGQTSGSFWYYDDAAPANATITVSDNSSAPDGTTGIDDSSHIISVLPVATKFIISGASSGTVDSSVSITIQAQKPDGNIDTNYQDDVTLVTSGSATGGGLVDIINGSGTKNISNTIAETTNLSLSDTEATGLDISSTHQIAFSAGALSQFTLTDVVSMGAGTRAEYTVTRKDQHGNLIVAGSPSTVYLYSNSSSSNDKFYDAATDGNIITSIQIAGGQSSVSFWYYDDTLGTWTITASDNSSSPDGNAGVHDALDSILVVAGATGIFEVNNPGGMTAGTRLGYTVSRKDSFGNHVTSGSQTVYLYSSSVSTSTAFYDMAIGGTPVNFVVIADGSSSVDFWYTDGVAGTYTLTMSDNGSAPDGATGIADATRIVNVSPVPIVATRFVILDPPTSATVDAAVTITVQAQDDSGNIDTSNTQSVTLSTTGSATGGGVVTMVNGVGTKNISNIVAQTITLSLVDTAGTGLNVSSSKNLTFAPGVVAQLALNNPGEMSAGTRQEYTVTRKDQFGNTAASGLTKLYLYTASASSNAKFYEASSGGSVITFVDVVDGSSSAKFWYYDEISATTTVTVSDNATAPDGLTGIADVSNYQRIIPGTVDKFIINNPGDMFAGTRLGFTVTRKDAYENLITSGANLAYLYSNSSGANKKFYDSASGGLIVTLAVIDDGKSSANFWYYDEEPGTWVITVSDNAMSPDGLVGVKDGAQSITVSLVPIVATKLVIQAPTMGTVGSPVAISVQAEDNNGNIDTSFAGQVTLNISGPATGGGVISIVNGVGVSSVTATAAGSVNLSLNDSGDTGLNVASQSTIIFSTTPTLQPGFTGSGVSPVAPIPVVGGVTLTGRAYPGAKLSVLAIGEDTEIIRQSSVASSLGNFEVSFRGIDEGKRAYGLLVQDKDGRSAQAKTFDVNLVDKSNIVRVANILVSPTIGFTRATVTKGDLLTVVGYASPNANIQFELNDQSIIERAVADASGFYRVQLRTGDLDIGGHSIKARQIGVLGLTSDFSPQKVFNVSNLLVPQVDFNNDGKVDVRDWSIFLARWNSKDPNVRILNDLNNDGKVDVSDFSIFARTLRR